MCHCPAHRKNYFLYCEVLLEGELPSQTWGLFTQGQHCRCSSLVWVLLPVHISASPMTLKCSYVRTQSCSCMYNSISRAVLKVWLVLCKRWLSRSSKVFLGSPQEV
jgi:hypothetical protein